MRDIINLPGRHPAWPFSDAVRAGNLVYLSGRIGLKPGTTEVPDSPEEEIRLLLDGVREVLREAGLTMDDLVWVQLFCCDLSLFDRFNAIYVTYFSGPLPARAFVGSGPLLFGARFEICCVARTR